MIATRREALTSGVAALILAAAPHAARSQTYPARPVRMIVPFATGGPNDIAARLIAQKLSDRMGQRFFVENIGGGAGNIGMGLAAQAVPDGHTLLVAAPNYIVNPSLFDRVPYNPEKDFAPITVAVRAPTILSAHPSVPAQTVEELIALIRSSPGKFSYASPGIGTPPHLLGELFRLSLGLDLVHVPFSSGGLSMLSTLGGHTPLSFGALPPAIPHVKDGKLRALAITSGQRSDALPDVPTMMESGHPDISADIWTAVLAPAGTPITILDRLHQEIVSLLGTPDVGARFLSMGYQLSGTSPADTEQHFRAEYAKWSKVIRDAGIRAR